MQKIDGTRIAIILTNEQISELDKMSQKYGKTRSEFTRGMIDLGLTVTKDLETVGVFKLSQIITKAQKMIRTYRQPKLV